MPTYEYHSVRNTVTLNTHTGHRCLLSINYTYFIFIDYSNKICTKISYLSQIRQIKLSF